MQHIINIDTRILLRRYYYIPRFGSVISFFHNFRQVCAILLIYKRAAYPYDVYASLFFVFYVIPSLPYAEDR